MKTMNFLVVAVALMVFVNIPMQASIRRYVDGAMTGALLGMTWSFATRSYNNESLSNAVGWLSRRKYDLALTTLKNPAYALVTGFAAYEYTMKMWNHAKEDVINARNNYYAKKLEKTDNLQ